MAVSARHRSGSERLIEEVSKMSRMQPLSNGGEEINHPPVNLTNLSKNMETFVLELERLIRWARVYSTGHRINIDDRSGGTFAGSYLPTRVDHVAGYNT